jgi:aspartate/methionine/tyrosine aminotransferase
MGTPALRKEICHHYRREYGIGIDPERIVVANGSSAALFLTFASILDPGDQVILGTPHYSCYPNYIKFLGGKPVFIKLKEADGFQINPESVRKKLSKKTKAILINSPSNPTGTVLKPEVMKVIASLKTAVISDEIYHGLAYGRPAKTILEFTDDAFVLGGFSKRYAMTGWRIGYVIAPREFIRPIQKVQQNFQISPNAIAQEAAIAALKSSGAEAAKMKKEFEKRRQVMIEGLRSAGFSVPYEPEGAFYVFASCRFLDGDSQRLAFDILEKAGVAVTPGVDFGSAGEGYLRFSYTASTTFIREGVSRLKSYIRKYAV